MNMQISGDTIRMAGSLVTIIAALVGIVWYVAGLDARLRQLENQVHTLTVAPMIAASAGQAGTVSNPIAEACADLAKKAVEAASGHFIGASSAKAEAEDMMKALGCSPASAH
jgi:hypothetical protein